MSYFTHTAAAQGYSALTPDLSLQPERDVAKLLCNNGINTSTAWLAVGNHTHGMYVREKQQS